MKKLAISDFKNGMLLVFVISMFSSCTETSKENDQAFDLKTIAGKNSGISTIVDGKGFNGQVLKVVPADKNTSLTIWETGDSGNWNDANYFVFEVFGDNDYSGVITLEFYKKTSRTSEKIVLQSGEVAETEKEVSMVIMPSGDKSIR